MSSHVLNRASIAALVDEFYGAIHADAVLQPVFAQALGGNWAPHLARMVDFWSAVMLQAPGFKGNVFGKHMLLTGIQPIHFARWLALFEAAATRRFDAPVAAEFCVVARRIASSLQYGYAQRDLAG